jgi:hypothetical protein
MGGARRRLWLILLGVGFEGGFALLALLLGWLLEQPPLESFRWSLREAAGGVAACLPLVLGALALMRWPIGPLRQIQQFSEEVIGPLFRSSGVLDLAVISLLAGVGEEMVFRGVLQPVLGRWLGALPGLLLASILFGLLHPITPAYVVLAAAIGVYLGCLFEWTQSLLLVIVAHALYDFLVLLYLQRRYPDVPTGQRGASA